MMAETTPVPLGPSAAEIAAAMRIIRPRGNALLSAICPQQTRPIEAKAFLMPDELDELVGWVMHMNATHGRNVYFTVNDTLQTLKKASKAEMLRAVAYWSDCDPQVFKFKGYERAREHLLLNLLPKLKATASYIIDSGNGLSPFFTLQQPLELDGDFEAYERVNEAVGAVFDGPGTFNCDRIMRLPGTLNYPSASKLKKGYPAEPSLARMLHVGGPTYTPESMMALVRSMQLSSRFEDYLRTHPAVADRYAGSTAGLTDTSGSSMDFSMVSMLKLGGFEFAEVVTLLGGWRHGSASEARAEQRYWERCWERTSPEDKPVVDLSALLAKPVASATVRAATIPQSEAPEELLNPPGMLGAVTRWINATARKQQPMFAVQAAIATLSTVLGRRFVTTNRNWPSLYLLNIGKSASGKEHAKWAAESILEACDLQHLIGPASYTSNSGVLSALHDQPSHLTVIDEFGKMIEQASVKGNARAQSTLTTLIETWGRCDGTLRPQGYSTFGMNSADASKMKERAIRNPALTLMGMTVPETFFDTIGSAAARDGFLNRFIIVESDIGRQPSAMVDPVALPQEIIDWVKAVHGMTAGTLPTAAISSLSPSPIEVDVRDAAKALFKAFERECIGLMDQYEQHGLAEMFGRTNEIAMRLALIVAVSSRSEAPFTVEYQHADWAINYVRFHAVRIIDRLIHSVHDSEFEAAKQQVWNLLRGSGERGMTEREIDKGSRKFRGMTQRQQIELLNSLDFVGRAKRVSVPSFSGRGKPRDAWVATEAEDQDADEQAINADSADSDCPRR